MQESYANMQLRPLGLRPLGLPIGISWCGHGFGQGLSVRWLIYNHVLVDYQPLW